MAFVRLGRFSRNRSFALGFLLIVFILSRICYYLAGMRFAGETYLLGWQFIDPFLLKTDLWRSIFYLHSQPPLMNLLTGILLGFFPDTYSIVMQVGFLAGGLVMTLSIFILGEKLGLPAILSILTAVWFSISPATIIYENYFFYPYPLTVLLVLSAVFLIRSFENPSAVNLILFSFCLGLMALTWGLFHLVWLLISVALVLLSKKARSLKSAWLLPVVLLVFAWYAKNNILYDSFTASSWGGMNLAKIVTLHITEEAREDWVAAGRITEVGALPPFRSPDTYLKYYPKTPDTGIPLLDEFTYRSGFVNYHHRVMIEASERHFRDSARMILLSPIQYARTVLHSTYIYFHSSSDYKHILGIREPIDALDTAWNRIFYGQWHKGETFAELGSQFELDHVAWLIFAGFVLSAGGSITYLWKQRAEIGEPRNLLIVFMLWNILFVSAAGIMLDIGENNRFRFVIDPFVLLLSVFILHRLAVHRRTRIKKPGN